MKNMKKMKRLVALALSVVMVLAMSVFAFAAEQTFTITAPATTHQYEIYQIFTGDLKEEDGTLSNVKWGANGSETAGDAVNETVLDALTAVNSKTDREKLDVIEKYAKLSNPVAKISGGQTYSAVAGYYLIKDEDNSVTENNDFYTTYIVKVVGNVTIEPKIGVPSFEKKLKDTNDTTGETSGWQDSADYDIGDDVPFKLEGTVASNYANYKHYYFAFHDVEEKGLAFNNDAKVYVNGKEITSGYTVKTDGITDGCTFEVEFEDLTKIDGVKAGSKITVEYTSKLTDEANLGNQGNVNKAKLVFSNNPNQEQNGTPDTGETPWDNVIVFTYKVVVNKVDEKGDSLKGAQFTLKKKLKDGTEKTIATVDPITENTIKFEFKGLDDGDYILTETGTPAGYNTIDPIKFTVNANHTITWENENRTDLLIGLTGTVETGDITFAPNDDKSELVTNVVNKKGSTLPSTGGIGTTIFYVVGAILMVGAAVLLITKRRAEN